ncbi:NAD(P)H-dependent flavin oxidoreductase [Nannocystis radixulma]|uniref:Propionate 3-nitronate monooxygenase n=1 Tax=Nannocystis radixulma TaxID=2995305 RepID=A0ABT5BR43_9BACT|nr:nitronate monooxygenase [Nannocystis radixulma]MDC0675396.1 nitronate monooxygenase [Nannocystis radixulma]
MTRDVRTSALVTRWPIIQAPMAGGIDTPELAAAVSNAGGLGSLGCAYMTASEIEAAAAKLRTLTGGLFALNLFVRADAPDDPAAAARVSPILSAFRHELGLPEALPAGRAAPSFEAQFEAVLRVRPAVFSFTFGAPTREQVLALHARSIAVIGTATTVEEAELLAALEVDAVCAQGAEAGGHRGTFIGEFADALIGTITLVPQIAARVRVPVIAAGGIMDGRAIRAMLANGAAAVQLGTAFMACPEAGTSATHRAALATAYRTVVTRAFSGRCARGIRNRFSDAFAAVEAAPFPQQQNATRDLRAAAAAQGRADLMQMWAGQGAPMIRALPAAALVELLVREAGLES